MYFMNGGMLLQENVPILHVGGLELYRVAITHTWIASSPDSPIFSVNAACNIEMVGMGPVNEATSKYSGHVHTPSMCML